MKSTSLIAAAASCSGRGSRQDPAELRVRAANHADDQDGSHHVARLQSSDC